MIYNNICLYIYIWCMYIYIHYINIYIWCMYIYIHIHMYIVHCVLTTYSSWPLCPPKSCVVSIRLSCSGKPQMPWKHRKHSCMFIISWYVTSACWTDVQKKNYWYSICISLHVYDMFNMFEDVWPFLWWVRPDGTNFTLGGTGLSTRDVGSHVAKWNIVKLRWDLQIQLV
jgi:hypothetical protein